MPQSRVNKAENGNEALVVLTLQQREIYTSNVGLVRFQDCYFRFGSVLALKLGFGFFSVSVLLTTKTPPDVESASPSVGLI